MRKITLTLLIVASAAVFADAQIIPTARSTGLAGAGGTLMYGTNAIGWNPANLALNSNPGFSLNLLSFGASFGNDAYSLDYVGNTFVKGDTLSKTQIDDILGQMSGNELRFYGNLGIPLVGLSVGNYGLNVDAHVLTKAGIPSDVFKLMFTGPVKGETYDLSKVDAGALAYVSTGLTASKSLSVPIFDQFGVGATFKYLYGFGFADLLQKSGSLRVTDDNIYAGGQYRFVRTKTEGGSSSGDGIALDLGAAGHWNPMDIYFGATLGNLVGSMTWSNLTAADVDFNVDGAIDLNKVSRKDYYNDFFKQSDTTYDYKSDVTTDLPKYLLLAFDKPYLGGRGDLLVSYYQGFNDVFGQTTTPKLSLGSELRLWFLPLRVGAAFGGAEGSEYSAGTGIRIFWFNLDFAGAWQRGFATKAEGMSFAVSMQLIPGLKR